MKVLFISGIPLETNSSATIQNLALIKGFIELGHEIHILTTKINKSDKNYDNSIIGELKINKYELDLGNIYSTLRNKKENKISYKILSLIKKPLRWIYKRYEIYDGYKTAVANVKKINFDAVEFDLVISASDPKSSHLIAEEFIKLYPYKCKKWVQYWGDPLYLDVTKKCFFRKRLYNEEKRILSKADEIIYVSPMTYDKQIELYKSEKLKMRFIPLAYMNKKIYEKKANSNEISVGYFGYYYSSARNILPLYNSAKSGNYNLKIVGEGDLQLKNTKNVKILPRISYKEVEVLEENTDILVCLCNSKSTQIPGKIYYYAATNKPILVILDGNKQYLKTYLNQFNRFVFCDNNEEDIITKINEIKNGLYKHLEEPIDILYCKNIVDFILQNKKEFDFKYLENKSRSW